MSLPGRILFICHDGQIYGSQQSLTLILKHLPASAYRCYVSLARSGALAKTLEKLPNVVVLSHRRLQWVKHDVRSVWQKTGDVFALFCLVLPRTFYLINAIKRENLNMVHTNSVVSLEGAMAAKLTGRPHVWHIRELFMTDNPKLYMSLGKSLSRWIIHHFSDRVLCISEAVRNQFGPYAAKNPEKYVVLHNAMEPETAPAHENSPAEESPSWQSAGVDHRAPKTEPREAEAIASTGLLVQTSQNTPGHRIVEADDAVEIMKDPAIFTLGYVGRFSEGKRFHDLLEAAALLKRRGVHFRILAAGSFVDEAYERKIREILQRHHLTDLVTMLGYRQDLQPLYAALDLLVVPSCNEPFGRVVIEAMMHDIPCVATNSGGIPEIIKDGETGWLYPAKDSNALAAMLEKLIRQPAQLNPVRENARRMVMDRFTIERQIEKLDACYQELLSQNR